MVFCVIMEYSPVVAHKLVRILLDSNSPMTHAFGFDCKIPQFSHVFAYVSNND